MLFLVVSALLASAEPVVAASSPAQTPARAAKPKKICRTEETVTGSITPKRVCVTVPQAAPALAPARPAQDAASDMPQPASATANGTSN